MYMPMMPKLLIAMLARVRIGAIDSVRPFIYIPYSSLILNF
jgi:acyl-coenzyme A synthetase/AMP-(fatty) acid ligase